MGTEQDDAIAQLIQPYVEPVGRFVIHFADIENSILLGILRLSGDRIVGELARDMLFIQRLDLLGRLIGRRELGERLQGQWTNMNGRLRRLNNHRRRIVHNPPGGHVHIRLNPNPDAELAEIVVSESLLLSRSEDQGTDHQFQYTAAFIAERAVEALALVRPLSELLEQLAACPLRRDG